MHKEIVVAALMGIALTLSVATPASALVTENDTAVRQTLPPVMDLCVGATYLPDYCTAWSKWVLNDA